MVECLQGWSMWLEGMEWWNFMFLGFAAVLFIYSISGGWSSASIGTKPARKTRLNIADRINVSRHPSNGIAVTRLILNAESVKKVERLYNKFMCLSHKEKEERVFAAYRLKKSRLEGLDFDDCWNMFYYAAQEHEGKTRIIGSGFTTKVIDEAGEIQEYIFPELAGNDP